MMVELSLELFFSFVVSSSDFWHHPVCKMSFDANIANYIAQSYSFKRGLFLVISKTAMNKMMKLELDDKLLMSPEAKEFCLQALLNFEHFNKAKSG